MSVLGIEVVDVTKHFGDNVALNRVNLGIEEGTFFSFLGPSGCGKTTLLRIIAGFEEPTSGKLLLDGVDLVRTPPHRRPVNLVFQNYALFPHLTVAENVAFGLKVKKSCPKAEIAEKVKEALNLVRLGSLAGRYPSQLSGGQQQRVALARALINRPRVLLLDEPLSALDPQIRQGMQEELKSLQHQLNLTFVMVTHDQSEALAMSSKVAVFSRGNLEQVGTPEEIYERPQSTFVASFIGQTNLLSGKVASADTKTVAVDLGREIILRAPVTADTGEAQPGTEAIFLVKPHNIRIECQSSSDLTVMPYNNRFEGRILSASYQGFLTEFTVALANDMQLRVIQPQEARHANNLSVGTAVFGVMRVDDCSYFIAK